MWGYHGSRRIPRTSGELEGQSLDRCRIGLVVRAVVEGVEQLAGIGNFCGFIQRDKTMDVTL